MTALFGTDGIRGVAGQYPMTAEMARKVGRALAVHFRRGRPPRPRVVVGRDTRRSGPRLESALAAGLASRGADVLLAGVIPTPGVAFLVRDLHAAAGAVISASHNPYRDNGIKVFGGDGFKLPDSAEAALEKLILSGQATEKSPPEEIGRIVPLSDAVSRYADFLARSAPRGEPFRGLTLVLDCAHGAAVPVAPDLFRRLGARVFSLGVSPDGTNINRNCGSEHPEALVREVRRRKAEIGLAFDGDADRLRTVDETGAILTGDQLIAIFARALQAERKLQNNLVVTTVMSNLGLSAALRELGVRREETKVGDRYVLAAMKKRRAVLGGEDSGHIIFLDRHTTGDGLLSAVRLLAVLKKSRRTLSELGALMRVFPQTLVNVAVKSKPALESLPALAAAIRKADQELRSNGRILVRYSGTQPLCRVMVEGPSAGIVRRLAGDVAGAVKEALGFPGGA
jgi:phosphoglucosamine mutase